MLPLGDSRAEVALWRNRKHKCVRRGSVSNKTQSAIRPPLGALAGSARSRVALWRNRKHKCVRRDNVANKT